VQERLDIISRVRCCIKFNSEEEDDALYHPVDMNRVLDRLDEACAELSLAVPYAVCPTCQGRGGVGGVVDSELVEGLEVAGDIGRAAHAIVGPTCPLCKGRGLLSKHTFDTCVPEALKKNRVTMPAA
jgi:hypothetical protein